MLSPFAGLIKPSFGFSTILPPKEPASSPNTSPLQFRYYSQLFQSHFSYHQTIGALSPSLGASDPLWVNLAAQALEAWKRKSNLQF